MVFSPHKTSYLHTNSNTKKKRLIVFYIIIISIITNIIYYKQLLILFKCKNKQFNTFKLNLKNIVSKIKLKSYINNMYNVSITYNYVRSKYYEYDYFCIKKKTISSRWSVSTCSLYFSISFIFRRIMKLEFCWTQ